MRLGKKYKVDIGVLLKCNLRQTEMCMMLITFSKVHEKISHFKLLTYVQWHQYYP